ncbi:MAG: rRNA maturation RNase YbeY, partial [Candidatus Sulfotelmatobacter sp.]
MRGTVNVLMTTSRELRALNRTFRGKDKATDVLSFPAQPAEARRGRFGEGRFVAGEVAISVDIARDNARRLGHPVAAEVKILALHGILHLAGFDHENDNGEMAREEMKLRQLLKLEIGLIERSQSRSRKVSARTRQRDELPPAKRRIA